MGSDGAGVKNQPDHPQILTLIDKSGVDMNSRLLIGTATRGTIRMEWHQARIGLIMPVNWAELRVMQSLGGYMPLGFLVADAQNLIIAEAIKQNVEWLLLYEDDMLPKPDAFIHLNQYMISKEVPVVSALYYTKSRPAEPLVFRGRGNGYFPDWEMGDRVWCDGVPTGFLLVHMELIRAMWEDCEPYDVRGRETRRMFRAPRDVWMDPETGHYKTVTGTSDLDWSARVCEGDYLAQAGWEDLQDKEYPLLVDTNIFCHHIAPNGETFP